MTAPCAEPTQAPVYPVRRPVYALHFLRAMRDAEVPLHLGQQAALLLMTIATREDQTGCSRGVEYYNDTLAREAGFRSVDALQDARRRAVAEGWLTYLPGGRGRAGVYWTLDPTGASDPPAEYSDSSQLVDIGSTAPKRHITSPSTAPKRCIQAQEADLPLDPPPIHRSQAVLSSLPPSSLILHAARIEALRNYQDKPLSLVTSP